MFIAEHVVESGGCHLGTSHVPRWQNVMFRDGKMFRDGSKFVPKWQIVPRWPLGVPRWQKCPEMANLDQIWALKVG